MNNIKDIQNSFKLPLAYCSKISTIDDNIISDLELIKSSVEKDNLDKLSLYESIFCPKTKLGQNLLESWTQNFSYDKKFLSSNQDIFKTVSVKPMDNVDEIFDIWTTMKNDTGFISKYHYVEWDFFESLNRNSSFLQLMSVYSLTSPVISLLLPVLLCIVPFFLLKIQKIEITLSKYFEILKKIITQIPIGKLAYIKDMSWDNKVYTIVSAMFYIFQLYQNILSCWRFYKNQYHIVSVLSKFRDFINYTIEQSDEFLSIADKHTPYLLFNENLKRQRIRLIKLYKYLENVLSFRLRFKELRNIGYTMKHFYEFYKNNEVKETMNYAFGLNAFFDHICGVQQLIGEKKINKCGFTKKRTLFKNAYYPLIAHEDTVKNTYSLKTNAVITGPNAAGKTTMLKTTLFNILLSQQIGFGFYKSAKITPYKHLHCYLNIPDTSGRDSLFQAEARRCKIILDKIKDSSIKEKHFCIFDELYSGTNPYEATASAFSYLEHLSNLKNVDFMITTHYIELCKKLKKDNIKNFHMAINNLDDKIRYTYLLKEGISEIKGGIKVLKDLGYPDEMIDTTNQYLSVS